MSEPGNRSAARAVDLRVSGRVQGVSFRAYAASEAERLGVTGWVRNEADGSVALHAEGEDAAVEELVAWCRTGSPAAYVEGVDITEAEPQGVRSFEVRS